RDGGYDLGYDLGKCGRRAVQQSARDVGYGFAPGDRAARAGIPGAGARNSGRGELAFRSIFQRPSPAGAWGAAAVACACAAACGDGVWAVVAVTASCRA